MKIWQVKPDVGNVRNSRPDLIDPVVNVDNDTLRRIMANKKALDALMSIEGFRNLNQDIETIINKSEAVNKVKKDANGKELSQKEKKQLTEEEKEYKGLRKQIQVKKAD